MKWSPVYHVSTIFRNHMTAVVLWVKVTLLSAYLQTKWRPKRTCFDGEIESQTRVPHVSSPTCDLSSVLRVNGTLNTMENDFSSKAWSKDGNFRHLNPSLAAFYLPTWVPTAGFFWVCVFFSSASLKCHITSVLHLLPPQTQ